MAGDDAMSDVWYNLSHVTLSLGDINLTQQCLKLAITSDPTNAEAYNNLGVLGTSTDRGPSCDRALFVVPPSPF